MDFESMTDKEISLEVFYKIIVGIKNYLRRCMNFLQKSQITATMQNMLLKLLMKLKVSCLNLFMIVMIVLCALIGKLHKMHIYVICFEQQ